MHGPGLPGSGRRADSPLDRGQPTAGWDRGDQGSEPLRFDGWLELVKVVSELVAAAPSSDEDADAAG